MDVTTLGAALAIAKSIPGTAIGEATQAADRAQEAAKQVTQAAESIQHFEETGLIVIDGKLCVKVERSE